MKKLLWLAALLGSGFMFCAEAAEPASASRRLFEKDNDNRTRVREYLTSRAFRDFTVRVYYRAECRPAKSGSPEGTMSFPFFPSVNIEAPTKGETGLAAARHIFRNAKNVTVREDPGRVIRVWIGNVPTAILRTKIAVIKLDKNARETKLSAVEAILDTKEVQEAMKTLRVGTPSYTSSEQAINPPPYPPEMRNVTFDQALDAIAQAWDGIVIYGACAQPDESGTKLFDIEAGNRVFF